MMNEDKIMVGALTLLVKTGVFTLEQLNESLESGLDNVWELLNDKYKELEEME